VSFQPIFVGAVFALESMGMSTPSQLDRFVSAVHRRMFLLRAAERLGLCLLGGCVVLFILMPILIWRSQATTELALITSGASLLAGVVWSLTSRPTKLAAAMEADRQLKLHDLLGTALLLKQTSSRSEIEQTVLSQADIRSSQFSPSAVVLHRLGARGWGGIGLAVALVIGLSLMGPDSSRAAARASLTPRSWQDVELDNQNSNATHLLQTPDMRRPKVDTGTDDTDPLKSNMPDSNPSTVAAEHTTEAPPSDPGVATEGTGGGAGQSTAKSDPGKSEDPTASGSSKNGTPGNETAGGGGTSIDNGSAAGKSGHTAAPGKAHKPAPVWQSQSWPADQESARSAIRSGQIPDAYRDLVRDYFERD
jgi:hypothetical protein